MVTTPMVTPVGSLNHDDWYKNYSVGCWIENDKAEKGE